MKCTFLLLLITLCVCSAAHAQVNASSCSSSDVQTAINSATEGQTVNVPSCPSGVSWTSGVSISGKGITLKGAGGGRVVAVDVETSAISIGTGSKTFSSVTNDQGATAYLGATSPGISAGETLLITEMGFQGNYMQGTVTSFSGSTLVMNITSDGGSCGATSTNMTSNCKRWLISTLPSTVILNNSSANLITITEDTSYHTTVTGFQFGQGSGGGGSGETIFLQFASGGVPILIHDNTFISNQNDIIDGNTNRGVIWNNSFIFSPYTLGQYAALRIQDGNNSNLTNSWNTISTFGTNDVGEVNNQYFETNDVHGSSNAFDVSDDARMVIRYNVLDNSGGSSHGADTGFIGARYFEYYNNAGIFEGYNSGSTNPPYTAPMQSWFLVRGGTFVWHDNTLPAITSTDDGSKQDINLTNQSLQRNQGSFPCWGAGASTSGQYYARPHQVGFGYITGTTTYTYTPLGFTNATTYSNATNFQGTVSLGDIEPAYIWNNSRTQTVVITDYCNSTFGSYNCGGQSTYCSNSPQPDVSSGYIQSGREYYNGTAKPNYTAATYPNPLTGNSIGLLWIFGTLFPLPPVY